MDLAISKNQIKTNSTTMRFNIIIFLMALASQAQTLTLNDFNEETFLGNWEYIEGNQRFVLNFFSDPNSDNEIIRGHYTMYILNSNGIEEIEYTSDKEIIPGQPERYMPLVSGPRKSWRINEYFFALWDNTCNKGLKLARLSLTSMPRESGAPYQIQWKLEIDGIGVQGDPLGLPKEIVLKKIE